jgi:hypothetical protein
MNLKSNESVLPVGGSELDVCPVIIQYTVIGFRNVP